MSTDFIARWSRRKRGVDQEKHAAPLLLAAADGAWRSAEVEGEADAAGTDQLQAAAVESGNADAPAPELTDEELAALPDPEELTAASDITGFLRQGVPAALRNRALRRMWSIDPAIRDAVGDARDYAWDWNIPGGMPVSGPISSSIDVDKMVRGIFGTERAEPEAAPDALPASASIHTPADDGGSVPELGETHASQASGGGQPVSLMDENAGQDLDSASPKTPEEDSAAAVPRRPLRHGGALPA